MRELLAEFSELLVALTGDRLVEPVELPDSR
jgi:hypothetical protein